jgi:hypothetical protein
VGGAFARYLSNLYASAQGDTREIEQAQRAIDRLAASADPDVVNVLQTEVFEHVDLSDRAARRFKSALGAHARQLYDEWM